MNQEILYAYLAGIIDGEGCISIRKLPRKYLYYNPMIEVGMTVRAPIDLLAKTFGNSVWYEVPRNQGRWKNQHKWRVAGKNVIPVLNAILPYLTVKKEQALVALEFASIMSKRGSKWSPDERISQNAIREPLFQKMYSLNHW